MVRWRGSHGALHACMHDDTVIGAGAEGGELQYSAAVKGVRCTRHTRAVEPAAPVVSPT
ncbi:uncharacterized protein K452DRAFT_22819 [Aplosporella prunicola CBS 121167]|uniref:Uncharacterized protein n=1 Tax=Aplosporella prunicola CBS 121167 TaxID=1176127 RepID=A0A6A6AV02_9PEZI|nr:uncharacterized protein K452DRAFT_22819 [Aplosporella prunicola CBS 121167]KAF2135426.1 hypothetical protein K452DRAFT_22819 [Aplosporella prunicola CBS 121167]